MITSVPQSVRFIAPAEIQPEFPAISIAMLHLVCAFLRQKVIEDHCIGFTNFLNKQQTVEEVDINLGNCKFSHIICFALIT